MLTDHQIDFIEQTANDYQLPYEMVEKIYIENYPFNANKFYTALELEIKKGEKLHVYTRRV